jgi:hypothetical protein
MGLRQTGDICTRDLFYWTEGRVMAVVRIDSIWNVIQNPKLAEGSIYLFIY